MKLRKCFWSVAALLLLALAALYLLLAWRSLPQQVPGHYNSAGEITRWGSKGELWVLPCVGLLLFLLLHGAEWLALYIGRGMTPAVALCLTDMLGATKLLLAADFAFLTVNGALARPLPRWFTPAFLTLFYGSLLFFIVRLILAARRR
ncbi:MAG: DUF1648 domain-containing protein [Oscillospiraceae bacterium]